MIWLGYALAPKAVTDKLQDEVYKMTEVILIPKEEVILIQKPKAPVVKQPAVASIEFKIPKPDETSTTVEVPTTQQLEGQQIAGTTIEGTTGTPNGLPAEVEATTPILAKYLGHNLKYPHAAVQNGISGKVYIKFIVDENGNLISPEIVRGLGYGCEEEVLRILASMPKWNPGKVNGQAVKVRMTLPVSFQLSD